MQGWKALLLGVWHHVILSYKSTLLGIIVSIGVYLLGQAQAYPNEYVRLAAGLIIVPFLAWKDKAVADGSIRLLVIAFVFLLPLRARADGPAPAATDALVTVHPLASAATFTVGGQLDQVAPAPAAPTVGTLADVAPSDPAPATPTRFGGCNKVGTFCYGPAANISLVLFNMKTKDFAFGIVPGAGYGITLFANQPYKLGIAGFGSFKSSSTNSPASGMGSVVVSFAEYVHLGAAYEVLGGSGTPYLLGSVGANL